MNKITATFSLSSRLRSLPLAEAHITPTGSDEQDKKQARKKISLEHSSSTLGFLHAVLVQINDNHFLLAGPSGIGKSTYAGHLDHLVDGDVKILASDWVAIERDAEAFYVSDLNFEESIRHKQRCKLSGVIFLTHKDIHNRDAFYPNSFEYKSLLKETFDTASKQELAVLNIFWQHNRTKLPFMCSVPARQKDEAYITSTLHNLCTAHAIQPKQIEVGVIGVGALGSTLAFQLGQLSFVKKVHLYNRNSKKSIGYAADMNQALLRKYGEDIFVAHNNPEEVFKRADSVFLCFRDETPPPSVPKNTQERWEKVYAHLPIVRSYAHIASKTKYNGAIFMLSNPVDILAYAFYAYSQQEKCPLRTYQVFGVGLELDVARAFTFGKKQWDSLQYSDIRAYGTHAGNLVLQTPLSASQTAMINTFVRDTSSEIREYIPRTIYGPVGATIKTFSAYTQGKSAHLSTIRDNSFGGEKIRFSHRIPQMPPTRDEQLSSRFLEENRQIIAQYIKMR